jgi:hypothetical protein
VGRRLLGLAFALAVSAALPATTLAEAQASHDSFSFSDAGTDGPASAACEFTVMYTLDVRGELVFRADGTVIVHINATRTRYANGRSIMDNDAFTDITWANGIETVTGTSWNINLPGSGIVFLGAGKFEIRDGVLSIIGGPEDWIASSVYPVVCAALAA